MSHIRVEQYRKELHLKEGKQKSVFEVLAQDVLSFSHDDPNQIEWGICNNKKSHWALFCDNQTISFVWDAKEAENKTVVSGAKCITDYERLRDLEKINWLGVTRLSVDDIKKAGILLFQQPVNDSLR